MVVRDGMSQLIMDVRQFALAGTADFTLGTATYFTDQQIQDILDRTRDPVYEFPLIPQSTWDGGSEVYKNFYYRGQWVERADSGSAAWQLRGNSGTPVGTANYTVDYNAAELIFTANQVGSPLYLDYRKYNLYAAVADVLRMKIADARETDIDIKIDNHDVKRSQRVKGLVTLLEYYEDLASGSTANVAIVSMSREGDVMGRW